MAFGTAIIDSLNKRIRKMSMTALGSDWNTLQRLTEDRKALYSFGDLDGFSAMESLTNPRLVCAPNSINARQAANIAERYIQERPNQ
jgi:hypothetical protein